MIFQQMKSSNSIKIQVDNGPTLTYGILLPLSPSIAIDNYNHHTTSISNEHSTVINLLFITDTRLLLPVQPRGGQNNNNLNCIQQLLVLLLVKPCPEHNDNP